MYQLKSKFAWMTLIAFLIVLLVSQSWAGTTGKIVGFVSDAENGEPLPGVNIVIEGQPMGAATDMDGLYLILNVPPGYYDISAIMIGYRTLTKQNVQILTDRTVDLNFKLETTVLETEEIVVQAERPLIKRDETNKTAILDFEVFAEMPIQEIDQAVAAQAGMVADESGDLHLRGGRAGEIAFMIDGILVQDPWSKSGVTSVEIDKSIIQELQLQTGAFGAEYGQAMSGVINVVTKEGKSKKYNLFVEYESPFLEESPYRKVDWMLHTDLVDVPAGKENEYRDSRRWYKEPGDSTFSTAPTAYDPVGISQYEVPKFETIPGVGDLPKIFGSPLYGYLRANISGPVPFVKNLTFFLSSRYTNNYSRLPFGYNSRREFNGKFTYRYEQFKINARIQRTRRYYKPYDHLWKYRPDAYEDRQSIIDQESLELTHTLSNKSFYTLRLFRYYDQYFRHNPNRNFKVSDLPEVIYNDPDSLDFVMAHGWFDVSPNGDTTMYYPESDWEKGVSNSDGFYYQGDRGRYEDQQTTTYAAKFDLVYQIFKQHEIKTGLEYKYFTVERDRWRYPWPGTAHYVEIFDHEPVAFNAYIQDKMEYEHFVLNIGLRYDFFDPRHTMWEDIYNPGQLVDDGASVEWVPAKEVPADPQIHFSPRIGIAYPVSERMVFHSNYGHYYENPSLYNMYKHHDVTVGGIPLLGNPSIKSQKTIQYEFGVKTQLGEYWALDVNAYFKDITNLAASSFKNVFPYNFTVFDNSDYASVKGIDVSLERKVGKFFTGILNYSLSEAKGNESSASDGYNNYRGVDVTLRPNREYYLDFDRRHDFSLNLTFKTPRDFGPTWLGAKMLSHWNLNLLIQAASGLPYTPFVEEGNEGIFIEKNTGRKPWYARVDLRLQKRFDISNSVGLVGFLVVKNLFDKLNTNYVWTRTGQAWDAGPTSSRTQDRIHNPANVSIPRQISVGFQFLFNTL